VSGLQSAIAVTKQNCDVRAASKGTRHCDVKPAVVIKIAYGEGLLADQRIIVNRGLEGTVSVARQHTQEVIVDNCNIELMVAVEIADRNESTILGRRNDFGRLKCPVCVSHEHADACGLVASCEIQISVAVKIAFRDPSG
jgi:hypothetical protein